MTSASAGRLMPKLSVVKPLLANNTTDIQLIPVPAQEHKNKNERFCIYNNNNNKNNVPSHDDDDDD
jgi:hypothetical protein